MGAIVSALTFVKLDQNGVPWTEGWFVGEFQDNGAISGGVAQPILSGGSYQPGGESFGGQLGTLSGYAGGLQQYFHNIQFMQVTRISGAAFQMIPEPNMADVPGPTPPVISGVAWPGTRIRLNFIGISGTAYAEVLSGVVVSGLRVLIHAIGT